MDNDAKIEKVLIASENMPKSETEIALVMKAILIKLSILEKRSEDVNKELPFKIFK